MSQDSSSQLSSTVVKCIPFRPGALKVSDDGTRVFLPRLGVFDLDRNDFVLNCPGASDCRFSGEGVHLSIQVGQSVELLVWNGDAFDSSGKIELSDEVDVVQLLGKESVLVSRLIEESGFVDVMRIESNSADGSLICTLDEGEYCTDSQPSDTGLFFTTREEHSHSDFANRVRSSTTGEILYELPYALAIDTRTKRYVSRFLSHSEGDFVASTLPRYVFAEHHGGEPLSCLVLRTFDDQTIAVEIVKLGSVVATEFLTDTVVCLSVTDVHSQPMQRKTLLLDSSTGLRLHESDEPGKWFASQSNFFQLAEPSIAQLHVYSNNFEFLRTEKLDADFRDHYESQNRDTVVLANPTSELSVAQILRHKVQNSSNNLTEEAKED